MSPARNRFLDYLLLGVVLISGVLAVATFAMGGFATSVEGIRLSSRSVFRPSVIAAAAALFLLHRVTHRHQQVSGLWATTRRHAGAVAACLAVLAFVIAIRFSAFEAVAADQYGYISQAELWVRGNLIVHEPLAAAAPWPEPARALAPLGYRPGQQPATIVPTYPPGLPLKMAGLMMLVGPLGAYLAVPLMGTVAIGAAFLLGTRMAGATCGLMSATLLLTSPIFLFQLKEPMSDVPVTAWWLVALVLLTVSRSNAATALAAGLAGSAAILTRPNLVPLAVPLGMFVLLHARPHWRRGLGHASLFAAGLVPGCVAVGLFNQVLYGSPLASGYGSMTVLFEAQYFGENLARYPRWLIETETPFVLLALVAPALIRGETRRVAWLFLAAAGTLYACYAFYVPFDNWTFLRFLLPAIALLLILSSVGVLVLSARLQSEYSRWVVAALFCLLLAWRWDTADMKPLRADERRFAVVGAFVREELPSNAIIVAIIHSGSVRHYSSRRTLRWDLLGPEWLDPALAFLRTAGYRPYLLIEDWEQAQYLERFTGHSKIGALDWPPLARYTGGVRAEIFDPEDRDRFLAGERITTRTIEPAVPH